MNTPMPLLVKHTVSYKDEPLAVVQNFLGMVAELSPTELRVLATALLNAAHDCELVRSDSRRYGPIHREYSLSLESRS